MGKADFEKYQAQQTGAFHLNDLTSHPHMTQILQQLLDIMQQNQQMNAHFNNSERSMGARQQGRRPYQNNNGAPRQPYNNRPQQPGMGQNMPMGGQQQMGQPMPQMTNGMPVPQQQRMPQAPMPNMMAPPQAPMPAGAMQSQNNGRSILVGYLQVDPSHL